MTRRRWIADEYSDDHAALTGSHAQHLTRVLRAKVGQEFDIAAGSIVRRGRITVLGDNRVEFELEEEVATATPFQITVILSVFKFARMEWAIEKCTELGASRIIPMIARRTEAHLGASAAKRVERWERIAHQAAQQSRGMVPPEIPQPMSLKEVVLLAGETRIMLAESEATVPLHQALQPRGADGNVLLAFGPEGGWTEYELDLFRKSGWILASLGKNILRAETASIAALAVVMSELH